MFQTAIDRLYDLDKQLFFLGNQSFRTAWLDVLMPICSLPELLWGAGVAVFGGWTFLALRGKDRWKRLRPVLAGALLILGTAGLVDLAANTVKCAAGRLRPYQLMPDVYWYSNSKGWQRNSGNFSPFKSSSNSFFSGHAAHSMAVAVTVGCVFPPVRVVVYAIPLLSGGSRIYMGKHYPSDVLAGWLAGWLIATAVCRSTRRLREGPRPDKDRAREGG